ncbi:MAG: class I SAM-dependent methyltransferase [Steroidobacteraceae bacterium]
MRVPAPIAPHRFASAPVRLLLWAAVGLTALALAPAAYAATPPAVQRALEAAINGPQRTPAFKTRDPYRHPLQTLEFFGIRPDMRVIEVLPGGGWYTEILAPFLHAHGQLIEATSPVAGTSGWAHRSALAFERKLAADPAVYGNVRREPFELPGYMHLGAPDSADMVVTFNNMHDLMFENVHHEVTPIFLETFLRSAYHVLKPDGVLGIVGHRCAPGTPLETCFPMARLPQAFVIHEAEAAGFRLAGTSEILANPKDPRNIPVFFLPPTLADRSAAARRRYAAIGYADDYTLRFVKPAD